MIIVFALILFFVGIVIWMAIYAACEAWSLWAQHKYRIRFRLHTFLIISTAACATTAIVSNAGQLLIAETVILTGILYPLLLGVCFFADMLIRDAWQAIRGRRGKALDVYHHVDDALELDEAGEPIVPADDPTGAKGRRRERQRPKISVIGLKNAQGFNRD